MICPSCNGTGWQTVERAAVDKEGKGGTVPSPEVYEQCDGARWVDT